MRYPTLQHTIKRFIYSFAALGIMLFTPAPYVFAESAASPASSVDTASCSPVAPAPTGIQGPTGSDASTYTYNSCTGLWENPYYTWSPATQTATPKTPLVYSCDQTTWQWVTHVWVYAPASQSFIQTPVTQSTLPAGAVVAPDSLNPCAPPPVAPVTPTSDPAGAGGSTTLNGTNTSNTSVSNQTNASMQNNLGLSALTGNASVLNNLHGGSASSGDATATTNVLNAVQTVSTLTGTTPVTFVATLNGDVQGNLIVDPNALQPASSVAALANSSNLTVNNQATGSIANTINVGARSGDATVAGNTTAGNATSGNAAAIADVVNMLNSVVSAGKSFVGVINVNGNLNGSILMPQSFLDSLVASNAPNSTMTLTNAQANSLGLSNTTNLATTNTVHSTAATGNASVADNTQAGSATSGAAATNVRIFNLTGNQVIGANCLLVFVNVSGQWVGVIMNAPNGATAAALGSGITANNVANTDITNRTDNTITNDVTLAAASGNATVQDNTTAGNARSGNANTAVNLLNMNSAQFSLTGWFGILFINVFGNWYGNFGVFTPPTTPAAAPAETTPAPAAPPHPQMFQFIPNNDRPEVTDAVSAVSVPAVGAVLAAKTIVPTHADQVLAHDAKTSYSAQVIAGAALVAVGLATLIGERLIARRRAHSKANG